MKLIAYTTQDGTCSILIPNYRSRLENETDDDVLNRVMAKDLPADALHPTVINDTDLPYSGYRPETGTRTVAMRNSWVNPPDATSPPVVDMAKARKAKMDLEWRPRRDKLLAELDIGYQRADEQADQASKTAIARDKAKLRDMPVNFAAAAEAITDPVELDNFDPVIDIIISMESM